MEPFDVYESDFGMDLAQGRDYSVKQRFPIRWYERLLLGVPLAWVQSQGLKLVLNRIRRSSRVKCPS